MSLSAVTRTFQPHRLKDWFAPLLLLAAVFIASQRLLVTAWTDDLFRVQVIAILGVLAGLAIGFSCFSARGGAFFALAYGLFVIPWQLGLSLGVGISWPERLRSLSGRLGFALTQLFQGHDVEDPLLFLVFISIAFWALSLLAGYHLTRYAHPWQAILPTGAVLAILHTYDAQASRMLYLALYLFFGLVLVARLNYLRARTIWKEKRTVVPPYAGLDLAQAAVVAAAALLILSWGLPALASSLGSAEQLWETVTEPWRQVRSRLGKAFAPLEGSTPFAVDRFGENLALGRGFSQAEDLVLSIETPALPDPNIRLYWRAQVYDYYDGRWENTASRTAAATPDEPAFGEGANFGRLDARFTITTVAPLSLLYAPPEPNWVSRAAELQLFGSPEETQEVAALRASQGLEAGEVYQVDSSIIYAPIPDLRAAGADYPAAITERYLQLPDDVTPRTKDLAQDIVDGLQTPYDVAEAVTQYLRETIAYTDYVPDPPPSREAIDWMLFDYQRGFCNYYATAEVILLRSLGIPARLGAGYAQGQITPGLDAIEYLDRLRLRGAEIPEVLPESTDVFDVRQKDAHTWPEVYFPGVGWVQFEPTANQQPIVRPAERDPESLQNVPLQERLAQPDESESLAQEEFSSPDAESSAGGRAGFFNPSNWSAFLAAFSLALILLALTYRSLRRRGLQPLPVYLLKGLARMQVKPPSFLRRWAYRSNLPPWARAYLEINAALSRLGSPPAESATPTERADHLAALLPDLKAPILRLCEEYQLAAYSPRHADVPAARLSARLIRNASRNASLLARLRRLFPGRK